MHRKIVVTGGAGFVGSHLVDCLLAETCAEIVVFDNLSRGRLENLAQHTENAFLRFVKGDVRDAHAVKDALRGANIVYHLAAYSDSTDSATDIDEIFSNNVVGTLNVLRAAVANDARRLILASSCEVYGPPIVLPVDEGHPLLPTSMFGSSKMAAEALCRGIGQTGGLQTVIVRLATVYGPRDSDRLIPQWITAARTGEMLRLNDGEQVIDVVWVGQVVDALIQASAPDLSTRAPINVASGTGTRLSEIARRIVRLAGRQGAVDAQATNSPGAGRFVADVQRMQLLLGVEPLLDPLAYLVNLFNGPAATSVQASKRQTQSRRGMNDIVARVAG